MLRVLLVLAVLLADGAIDAFYDSSYAYVTVENTVDGRSRTFCCNYQQYLRRKIAASKAEATPVPLEWWTEGVGAARLDVCAAPQHRVGQAVVPLPYRPERHCGRVLGASNLTQFLVRRLNVSGAAAGLFLVNRGQLFYSRGPHDYLFSDFRDATLNETHVPIYYVYTTTFDDIISMSSAPDAADPQLSLSFHRPASYPFDLGVVFIFLLAVVSAVAGGCWSGLRRFILYERELLGSVEPTTTAAADAPAASACAVEACGEEAPEPQKPAASGGGGGGGGGGALKEPAVSPMNCLTVGFMFVVIVGMLLLAYYFRSIIVWVFIVCFTLGSAAAAYCCLSAMLNLFSCGQCRVCWSVNDLTRSLLQRELFRCDCCERRPIWRNVLLLAICCSTAVCWFIFRNHPYGFVLQDLLAVFFCIHFLKTLRFPSLMWITILQTVMVVYDLFMVFLTPHLTSDGCSIMVEVATGVQCGQFSWRSTPIPPVDAVFVEKIPVVFRVPRLSDPMLPCYDMSVDLEFKPMMLGLGDVIIPGFLIGFCFGMDYVWSIPNHLYGLLASVCYALGMVVTFGALYLMETAQPALIYLIPCTLIPVILLAVCRGDFGVFWRGDTPKLTESATAEAVSPASLHQVD